MQRVIVGAVVLGLVGCTSGGDRRETPALVRQPATGAASEAAGGEAAKLQYKDAAGKVLLKLKPKEDGYKLYDGQDQVLGKLKVMDDRVKLKDAQDVERWKVKRKDYGAEVEDAAGQRLFKVKQDGDGDLKLVDASDTLLAKARKKDGGAFELRDPAGATLAKVKPRDGQVVFETEQGERRAELEGVTNARAAQWLALERFSLAERAALLVFFLKVNP